MPNEFTTLGSNIATVLGGGLQGDGTAYVDQLKRNYQAETAMQQARRQQALALIDIDRAARREGINPQAMIEAGFSEQAAPLLNAVLGASTNPDFRNLGKFQTPGYDVAADIARTSILGSDSVDPVAYNRATAFMEGKPYEPTRVLGGAYVPSGIAATAPEFVAIPTPTSLSGIERNEAAIRQGDARVQQGQQRTSAYVDKLKRPPATRAGAAKSDRPPTSAQMDAAELAQAREAIAAGADPAAVANRLRARGFANLATRVYNAPSGF